MSLFEAAKIWYEMGVVLEAYIPDNPGAGTTFKMVPKMVPVAWRHVFDYDWGMEPYKS